ncbi:MAG TPA: peptide deformylase [Kofleriaceae bacterium]|nr:peptide deformylase [Kofleriaceae bacterium]
MAALLKIVQAGDPVLRRRARELTPDEVRSPRIQQLIELMRDTMRDAPGVGLAAPQIGESIQLVVIEDSSERQRGLSEEDRRQRGREVIDFHVLINPELTVVDPAPVDFFEGCLSVRERIMLVPRARSVRVKALDARGDTVVRVGSGWYARILQHEIDHLQGALCIDRMESRSFMTVDQYERFWKGMSVDEVRAELGIAPP